MLRKTKRILHKIVCSSKHMKYVHLFVLCKCKLSTPRKFEFKSENIVEKVRCSFLEIL